MDWQSIQQVMTQPDVMWTLMGVSLALLLIFGVGVVVVLVRIPADYFLHPRGPLLERIKQNDWKKNVLLVGKNVLGALLLLAGLLMLVAPGQGLITVLAGLVLLDYPRKHAVERRIIARERVRGAINWLRRRFDTPPLRV